MGRSEGQSLRGTGIATLLAVFASLCLAAATASAAPTTIATFGTGAGKVRSASGVAVNGSGAGGSEPGTLYVADGNNSRIDKFDSEGHFLLAWGFGVADGKSFEPQTCGPAAEPPTRRCFIAQNASASGAVVQPGSLAVEPSSGDVFVTDQGKLRVSKFTPDGQFLRAFGGGVASGGAEGAGNLEAGSTEVKAVVSTKKRFLQGQILAGPGIPAGTEITFVNTFGDTIALSKAATETASGVTISAAEDPGNVPTNEVQKLTLGAGAKSGNFKLSFAAPAPPTGPAQTTANIPYNASAAQVQSALEALSGIGAGNVSVTSPNPGGEAGKPGGPYTVEFKGERYADTEVATLVLAKGEPDLSTTAGTTIETTRQGAGAAEVCTSGCLPGIEGGTGPGQFAAPLSLAFDPEGKLWVGDTARLQRFDPDGSFASEIALPGAGNVKSLAIDSSGDFYLKGQALAGVRKLEAGTGAPLGTIDEAGNPETLTLDSAGDLYLGECGKVIDCTVPYRFKVFNPAGEQTSQFGAGQVIGRPGLGNGVPSNVLALDEGSGRLYAASSAAADESSPEIQKARVAVQAFQAPEPGPLAEDPRAEDILPTTATLVAPLNPEGHTTTYRFQYGADESYGQETPIQALPGTGFESETVEAPLTGLIPDTTYHSRLVATNHCNASEPAEECTVEGPDTTFTTRPAVAIEAQWATEVAARSAELHVELDPLGVAGQRWLEYGTSPCTEGGCAKLGEADLPASFGAIGASVGLSGLSPATTYHYRFTATDQREGTGYTVHGEDRTFATQTAALGFELPDGRAWEMVSPPDKHGGRIAPPDRAIGGQFQAAADGEALAYLSYGSLEAAPEGNRLIEQSSELSRRGPGGAWSTRDLTAPHTAVTAVSIGFGLEYKLFDPNLERALMEPRDTTPLSPEASERTPYLRETAAPTYTPLVSAREGYADVPPGTPPFGGDPHLNQGEVRVQAASADLGHVALRSWVALASGAAKGALYEWSAGLSPEARLGAVSVLPGGAAVAANAGSGMGSVRGAVSADGSRIFWSADSTADSKGLYVRDTARGETARLDEVQPGGFGVGEEKPLFLGADADGAVAFFTDTQSLTEDSSEVGADLYRCAVRVEAGSLGCDLTDLTASLANFGESAEVQGLLAGMGEDGGSAYFVARGVLDERPNGSGESAQPGRPNLYAWRAGEGTRYVATLAEEDRNDWGSSGPGNPLLTSQVAAAASPGGRYLAFMSQRGLTGYDNRDASSGEAAEEVFRYDAASEALACVSCNPSGERPAALRPGYSDQVLADPQELWTGRPLAAVVPEATRSDTGSNSATGQSLYRPRYVQDDGRVFFNAADSLVPADSNGDWDVYEYEPEGAGSCSSSATGAATALAPGGCVSLLSSGTATDEAAFVDASAGGRDVFFYTSARLGVADVDEVTDVYDAREGGEPAVLTPSAECQGEACQPPYSPPNDPTPASSSFEGAGNLREAARAHRACPKGKRKVKDRCVKPHRKRHHRRAHR